MNYRDPTRPPYFASGDRRFRWGTPAYRNLQLISIGGTLIGSSITIGIFLATKDRVIPRLMPPYYPKKTSFPAMTDEQGKRIPYNPTEDLQRIWNGYCNFWKDLYKKIWKW